VDVNVHPAKAEVRFRRSGLVHELITRTVMDRLRATTSPPGATAVPPPPFHPALPLSISAPLRLVPMPSSGGRPAEIADAMFAPPIPARPAPPVPEQRGFFSSLRVVGQIFEGYVVCQNGEAMVLIDQHAAHERVAFERLRRAYAEGGVARQPLLVPAIVELGAREAAVLTELCQDLERIGFEIEPFGAGSFAVRAVPALLADANPAALVHDLVEELAEVGSSRRLTHAAEDVLARLACHSVVRVGQSLTAEAIQALLRAMDDIDFAGNCPHGRPAFISFPRGELERRFRRT
jgi:DNA mismatch repair protein MutL